ncbi:MAG: GDP-L-fucose synthase [Mariniblastus sp.]|nr:GDP-L-fucose synthase [Mariniblastus sp.]
MSTFQPKRIYIAGHRGMVGSALVRSLQSDPDVELILQNRKNLDLCNQAAVADFFADKKPDCVIFAAAKVGGIHANQSYPAEFIYENLMMATSAIHAAYLNGVSRFLFLGSTCIYPRMAPQPMPESSLLSGPLESTNEAYALAKIAGLKMCEFYRRQYGVVCHSAMPTNLYGPGDNYHPDHSHVLPAMIRRFHEAKQANQSDVVIWGSGRPRREFLHVDDLSRALLHLVALEDPPNLVNVGTGTDVTIRELAELVAETVGFTGNISHDLSKPDGTPVKRTDISLIRSTGWEPTIGLVEGVEQTYRDFLDETKSNLLREV